MDNYNGFNRDYLSIINSTDKKFSGKVVKDILLTYHPYDENRNHLVITFEDKTFLSFGIEDGDKDGHEFKYITDDYLLRKKDVLSNASTFMYIDRDGTPKLYPFFKALVDIGLYNITAEELNDYKRQRDIDKEDREYREYLRLKEKYENKCVDKN